jgi:hypothetical protein
LATLQPAHFTAIAQAYSVMDLTHAQREASLVAQSQAGVAKLINEFADELVQRKGMEFANVCNAVRA